MAIISGDGQGGRPGEDLPNPLVVEVRDAAGAAIEGQILNFVVTSGGGSVFAGAAITDTDGRAQDWWRLGSDESAPQTLEVRAVDTRTGARLVFATFHAHFATTPVAAVSVTPCCFAHLVIGETIQYEAQALDADSKPLPGHIATWTSSRPDLVSVDQNGLATAIARTPEPITITARIAGKEQPVKVYASTAGPPAHLEKVSGDAQVGPPGQPLAEAVVLRVTDAQGRPVRDALVHWAPSAGGTVSSTSSATDAEGLGRTTWTPTSGANVLTATVVGLEGQSVAFTATGSTGGPLALGLDVVVEGLDHPVHLAAPQGDVRLFVVEQRGRVRVVANGQLLAAPFLDITTKVQYDGGERGLLSIAFHPSFATNRYVYLAYTEGSGDVIVERYTASAAGATADPATAKRIIAVPHRTYGNHNGGLVAFGPDGKLYLGVGDGGGGGDPLGSGQSLATLLGKLLRIDVDAGDPYAIPADNPFAGRSDARGEIWAYGLRNPWRWAFDAPSGRLYIADVGQNQFEEIDVVPASAGGLNFGWSIMEASSCFNATTCSTAGLVLPIVEYAHSTGCSITGGNVYRGSAIPELTGHYFYSDYCSGFIRTFRFDGTAARDPREWAASGSIPTVTSFGVDGSGELYVMSADGRIRKIVRR